MPLSLQYSLSSYSLPFCIFPADLRFVRLAVQLMNLFALLSLPVISGLCMQVLALAPAPCMCFMPDYKSCTLIYQMITHSRARKSITFICASNLTDSEFVLLPIACWPSNLGSIDILSLRTHTAHAHVCCGPQRPYSGTFCSTKEYHSASGVFFWLVAHY